jgi:5-(carboxyamino)imidazole ribonucleotide synthase
LQPGATIGILGGGQLGRMLAFAAGALGFDTHIYTPEQDSPASRAAAATTVGDYDDLARVAEFARRCDVVTYEFENVPAATARVVEDSGAILRPGTRALETAQDRLAEKLFAQGAGIGVAPFAPLGSQAELAAAEALLADAGKGVLKTRREGYDGKGQRTVTDAASLRAAWDELGRRPCVLEAFVPFRRELSVIGARGADGAAAFYKLCENEHRNHILHRTLAPAQADDATAERARGIAQALLQGLDYAGVLTAELFETADGALLLNEFAPRVHNSGHWTIEGALTSQFEQHVRAVAGWPLGDPAPLFRCEMTNLIGDDVDAWRDLAAEPGAHLHLYGKRSARPGRKMGHVTRLFPL